MTALSNGQVGRLELPDLAPADSSAQACPRPRAREDNPPSDVTVRELPAVRGPVAGKAAAALAGALTGGSLLHHRPRSMHQARAYHHEHAGHWTWPIARWLRAGWGYGVHMPYRVLALALDEVLASPAATVIVAALIVTFWFWH
jgi:hypothetical protein